MTKPLEIFLLEDDPADAEFARLALLNHKILFNLTTAQSVSEACDIFDAKREFDLMLIDYELPDGSGLKAISCAAETDAVKIVLTGSNATEVIREVDAAGAKYMMKPVAPAAVLDLLRAEDFWIGFARHSTRP